MRSNVTDGTPEELWRAYIQLTEALRAEHKAVNYQRLFVIEQIKRRFPPRLAFEAVV
ncbi:MAG: hypothetical protein WAM39_21635 [Bryobacteraceae bacterium]